MGIQGPRRPHLVLVEDDTSTLTGMVELLEGAGYQCTPATSFEHARAVLQTCTPDLLIADVRLGTYNGLQLVVGIPSVAAIIITGFDDPVLKADADKFGAAYLVKPVRPSELLNVIRAKLQSRSEPTTRA